jgi:amino acid efflux transporter
MFLLGLSFLTLIISYILNVDLETALLIPSGAAILVYIVGSASGIKLLEAKGARRLYPWISLTISIIMAFFVGIVLLVAIAFGAAGLFYRRGESSTRSPDPARNDRQTKVQ